MFNIIKKMKVKALIKYNYIAIRIAQLKNTTNTKCWGSSGKMESVIGMNVKWYNYSGKEFGSFLKKHLNM